MSLRPSSRAAVGTDRTVRTHLAVATLLVCALGCAFPGLGSAVRHCHPAPGVTPPMLMLLTAMFVSGFEVCATEVARALLRPGLLLTGLGVALLPVDYPLLAGVRLLPLTAPDVELRAYAVARHGRLDWPPLALVTHLLTAAARR